MFCVYIRKKLSNFFISNDIVIKLELSIKHPSFHLFVFFLSCTRALNFFNLNQTDFDSKLLRTYAIAVQLGTLNLFDELIGHCYRGQLCCLVGTICCIHQLLYEHASSLIRCGIYIQDINSCHIVTYPYGNLISKHIYIIGYY